MHCPSTTPIIQKTAIIESKYNAGTEPNTKYAPLKSALPKKSAIRNHKTPNEGTLIPISCIGKLLEKKNDRNLFLTHTAKLSIPE